MPAPHEHPIQHNAEGHRGPLPPASGQPEAGMFIGDLEPWATAAAHALLAGEPTPEVPRPRPPYAPDNTPRDRFGAPRPRTDGQPETAEPAAPDASEAARDPKQPQKDPRTNPPHQPVDPTHPRNPRRVPPPLPRRGVPPNRRRHPRKDDEQ